MAFGVNCFVVEIRSLRSRAWLTDAVQATLKDFCLCSEERKQMLAGA